MFPEDERDEVAHHDRMLAERQIAATVGMLIAAKLTPEQIKRLASHDTAVKQAKSALLRVRTDIALSFIR